MVVGTTLKNKEFVYFFTSLSRFKNYYYYHLQYSSQRDFH